MSALKVAVILVAVILGSMRPGSSLQSARLSRQLSFSLFSDFQHLSAFNPGAQD